ncbi:phospholipase A2, minor isoenzyme-like [Pelobates cultripes]|uniref:Phospholipase A2 n=1 Tax=Pelobates cultripes TaxID=61616 RepID=A0AAD1TGF9_PELCU|nr:phospholipase A2, minor isoenzyme-like [Pelobates cultripes]
MLIHGVLHVDARITSVRTSDYEHMSRRMHTGIQRGTANGNRFTQMRCCKIHDDCYGDYSDAGCWFYFDPYLMFYSYSCKDKNVTCSSDNNECGMHLCECDRKAALCFSTASYNETNKDLDKDQRCK